MSTKLHHETAKWAERNCPRAAILGESRTHDLVGLAIEQTSGVRIVMGVIGSLGGIYIGKILADEWLVSNASKWPYIAMIALGGGITTVISAFASQVYLRHKVTANIDSTEDL